MFNIKTKKTEEKIVNIVYQLRKAQGITQEDLADVLGVSRQTIIAIEKGNYIPSLLLSLKISNYFKLKLEDIFKYENK